MVMVVYKIFFGLYEDTFGFDDQDNLDKGESGGSVSLDMTVSLFGT